MIRPGWKVYAADGSEVGAVDEVTGDENADIFDGLMVKRDVFSDPSYVSADDVAGIVRGRVQLA